MIPLIDRAVALDPIVPVTPSLDQSPPSPRPSRGQRARHFVTRAILAVFLLSLGLVGLYRVAPPPATPLMLLRLVTGEGLHKSWTAYEQISPNLARAVIAAEDSGFCQHNGFDWGALDNAWLRNQHSKRIRGGSTISNQTAKNVFLWPDRTYIRKGFEFYFTFLIEIFWTKKRILEMYLNVAEWGHGVYGAEAAARSHFNKSARDLTRHEAALLAAILPNPRRWSASKPSAYIRGRAGTIEARMAGIPDPTGDPCRP
ncbi:MAG TPA: monofunctional biosynthetic peptidoglycan transglycosylase [Dongiaceae bacterium]